MLGLHPLIAGAAGSNTAEGVEVELFCLYCVGSGLCDGVITGTEESYRVWCV